MTISNLRGTNGRFESPNPRTPENVFEAYKKRVNEINPINVRKLEFRALKAYFDNVEDSEGRVRTGFTGNLGLKIYNATMDGLREMLPVGVSNRVDEDTRIETRNWIESGYEILLGLNKNTFEYLFGQQPVGYRTLADGLLKPKMNELEGKLNEISERRLLNPIFLEEEGKNYLVRRGAGLDVDSEKVQTLEDVRIIGRKIVELEMQERIEKAKLRQEMEQELLRRRIMFGINQN